ncbi:hypothetical protein M2302_000248 [Micromonospora sp. A200]|uniref:hypothetical protein n=1 Tax=Micromonospora sp. A200 TaxID=2940568 RepID=UPI00247714D6|nr:hypothetical protein [Micromonospora sp. A200]MDH6460097.1 hypothetical protein [Micromonospora sp. A200]
MTGWEWVAFILAGGIGVPTLVFLGARALVYRQSDPRQGQEYLAWFRAQKAAEHDEAVRAELARQTAARRRELVR